MQWDRGNDSYFKVTWPCVYLLTECVKGKRKRGRVRIKEKVEILPRGGMPLPTSQVLLNCITCMAVEMEVINVLTSVIPVNLFQ